MGGSCSHATFASLKTVVYISGGTVGRETHGCEAHMETDGGLKQLWNNLFWYCIKPRFSLPLVRATHKMSGHACCDASEAEVVVFHAFVQALELFSQVR